MSGVDEVGKATLAREKAIEDAEADSVAAATKAAKADAEYRKTQYAPLEDVFTPEASKKLADEYGK